MLFNCAPELDYYSPAFPFLVTVLSKVFSQFFTHDPSSSQHGCPEMMALHPGAFTHRTEAVLTSSPHTSEQAAATISYIMKKVATLTWLPRCLTWLMSLVIIQGQSVSCIHMHHRLWTDLLLGTNWYTFYVNNCWVKDHCHLPRGFRSYLKCGQLTESNFLVDPDPMEVSHNTLCWADYLWLGFDLMYLYWQK